MRKVFIKKITQQGHLTSLGAVSVAFATMLVLNIKLNWKALVAVYSAAETIYLFNFYKDMKVKNQFTILSKNKNFLPTMQGVIVFFIFLFFLIFIGTLLIAQQGELLVFGIPIILCGIIYNIFLKKLTQKLIGFKDFFVSFWWALIVPFIASFADNFQNASLFLFFLFILINVLIHEIILGITDTEEDFRESLRTFPLSLRKSVLIQLLAFFTFLGVMPVILGVYLGLFPWYSSILIFTFPYNFFPRSF